MKKKMQNETTKNSTPKQGTTTVILSPAKPQKPVSIIELTAENGDEMLDLFAAGLAFLPTAFEARLSRVNRYGDQVDLGPDYRTRMDALKLLLNLCVRGRKLSVLPLTGPRLSWELLEEYMQAEKQGIKEFRPKSTEKPQPTITKPDNIADLTTMHGHAIDRLVQVGLASLRGVISARKMTLDEDGEAVDAGPDIQVGLAAMNLITDFLIRGREMCPAPTVISKGLTWRELQNSFIEHKARLAVSAP